MISDSDNVWMIKTVHDLDLSPYLVLHFLISDQIFGHDLDRELTLGFYVLAEIDFAESTFAQFRNPFEIFLARFAFVPRSYHW